MADHTDSRMRPDCLLAFGLAMEVAYHQVQQSLPLQRLYQSARIECAELEDADRTTLDRHTGSKLLPVQRSSTGSVVRTMKIVEVAAHIGSDKLALCRMSAVLEHHLPRPDLGG